MARTTLFAIGLFATLLCACIPSPAEQSHRIVITSGVDGQNRPLDNRERFSFDDSRIYVYVQLLNITTEEHDFHVEAFDGNDERVWVSGQRFTPTDRSWNIWSWHRFDPVLEAPGTWTIEIYLDGMYLDSVRIPVARSRQDAAV